MGIHPPEPEEPAESTARPSRAPGSSAVRRRLKPALDAGRIVTAAVDLADAEGLPTVSMRRVAAEVGVPTMTLYGHLSGKSELVHLMLDSVLGELHPDEQAATSGHWRARVEAVARANWRFLTRHPWALHVATRRAPMGPGALRKYEIELRAVDGLGLSEVQMDLLVSLVNGFVRATVAGLSEDAAGRHPGTRSVPCAAPPVDPIRFPTAARVGPVAREELRGALAPERSFEFGLERLLDGIGVLILNPSR